MIVVPRAQPIQIPTSTYYNPYYDPSFPLVNGLPNPSFQSGRLAKSRNPHGATLSLNINSRPQTRTQTHRRFPSQPQSPAYSRPPAHAPLMLFDMDDIPAQFHAPLSPSRSSSASSDEEDSPLTPLSPSPYSTLLKMRPTLHSHNSSIPAFNTNTPPRTPTRPTHSRSPSAPTFPFSSSTSFNKYAGSAFQNSPPPKVLPKPKFLD